MYGSSPGGTFEQVVLIANKLRILPWVFELTLKTSHYNKNSHVFFCFYFFLFICFYEYLCQGKQCQDLYGSVSILKLHFKNWGGRWVVQDSHEHKYNAILKIQDLKPYELIQENCHTKSKHVRGRTLYWI